MAFRRSRVRAPLAPSQEFLDCGFFSEPQSHFQPKHPPRAGDRVGYAGTLRGSARGHDLSVCSIVTSHPAALCTTEFVFTKGTISAQSADFRRGPAAHATITGGRGVYNDTGGTIDIKSLSATRNTYTFHLTH